MNLSILYRVQIFNNDKWITIHLSKTLESAARVAEFEDKHGRLARVQKIEHGNLRRKYGTV